MGVHLGGRARVEQTMNVDLANIARSGVPIALGQKAVCCTGVVCRLCGQCGGGYNRISCLTHTCRRQEQYKSAPIFKTHLPSGAELPRSCACFFLVPEGGRHPWIPLNQP